MTWPARRAEPSGTRASAKSVVRLVGGISAGQQQCDRVLGCLGRDAVGPWRCWWRRPGPAQVDGRVPQRGHHVWTVAGADLRQVLAHVPAPAGTLAHRRCTAAPTTAGRSASPTRSPPPWPGEAFTARGYLGGPRVWEKRMGQLLLGSPRIRRATSEKDNQPGQAFPRRRDLPELPGPG
jgi:hypothetical protein